MAAKIRFGVYELDRDAMELRRQGMPVKVQEQPFRVSLTSRPCTLIFWMTQMP
jgi:hypothetical protein